MAWWLWQVSVAFCVLAGAGMVVSLFFAAAQRWRWGIRSAAASLGLAYCGALCALVAVLVTL